MVFKPCTSFKDGRTTIDTFCSFLNTIIRFDKLSHSTVLRQKQTATWSFDVDLTRESVGDAPRRTSPCGTTGRRCVGRAWEVFSDRAASA